MATALKIVPPENTVTNFVSRTHKLFINGKWVEAASGRTFATYNPATGEVLAQVAEGDRADIDLAVKAARAAFDTGPWRKLSPSERGRMIWKLADLIEENLEELAEIETLDKATPFRFRCPTPPGPSIWRTRYASPWASQARSFPGTSPC